MHWFSQFVNECVEGIRAYRLRVLKVLGTGFAEWLFGRQNAYAFLALLQYQALC